MMGYKNLGEIKEWAGFSVGKDWGTWGMCTDPELVVIVGKVRFGCDPAIEPHTRPDCTDDDPASDWPQPTCPVCETMRLRMAGFPYTIDDGVVVFEDRLVREPVTLPCVGGCGTLYRFVPKEEQPPTGCVECGCEPAAAYWRMRTVAGWGTWPLCVYCAARTEAPSLGRCRESGPGIARLDPPPVEDADGDAWASATWEEP